MPTILKIDSYYALSKYRYLGSKLKPQDETNIKCSMIFIICQMADSFGNEWHPIIANDRYAYMQIYGEPSLWIKVRS